MRKFSSLLIFILLAGLWAGCASSGYSGHNDTEAMDLAWSAYDKGTYSAARNDAKTALRINPDNVDAYNLLGLIELKSGDFKKSILYLEKGKTIVLGKNLPNGDYILCKLGMAYFKNNQLEQALGNFQAARNIHETSGTVAQVAMTLWQMGKLREGLDMMKQSRELGNSQAAFLKFLDNYAISPKNYEQLIRVLK